MVYNLSLVRINWVIVNSKKQMLVKEYSRIKLKYMRHTISTSSLILILLCYNWKKRWNITNTSNQLIFSMNTNQGTAKDVVWLDGDTLPLELSIQETRWFILFGWCVLFWYFRLYETWARWNLNKNDFVLVDNRF